MSRRRTLSRFGCLFLCPIADEDMLIPIIRDMGLGGRNLDPEDAEYAFEDLLKSSLRQRKLSG